MDEQKPLDLLVSHYFRQHKYLGAQDRRVIGQTLFDIERWHPLLSQLDSYSTAQEKLNTYLDWKGSTDEISKSLPRWAALGVTPFFYDLIIQSYGVEEGERLCKILKEEAPVYLRTNLLKTTRTALFERLQSDKFPVEEVPENPVALKLKKRSPLFSHPVFREGWFEVQDLASQQVASLVKARPSEKVLDFCSGSGGKALAIAPQMDKRGQLFLHDVRLSALRQAKQRFRRAGVDNVQFITSSELDRLHPLRGHCHWVLVDAPCSGSGTLRRHPDQMKKLEPLAFERLLQLQMAIVDKAISYLHPQGTLVYATCSLFPQENERQIDQILRHHPLQRREPDRYFPLQSQGPDAFFVASLCRAHNKDSPCQ
jgi:16S rRNA C967 or C1407 C5-methylase (RsmB/RsmF family)